MNSYTAQALAHARTEIERLEQLRSQGKDVPDEIYDGLLTIVHGLEGDMKLQQVFFPEFDARKWEKLLSEP